MGRNKKNIEISEESLNRSMQEIYSEATELRKLALNNYQQVNDHLEDKGDISNLTPIMNETLKVAEKALARKVQVVKVQADTYVKSGNKSEGDNEEGMNINDAEEIQQRLNNNEQEYD